MASPGRTRWPERLFAGYCVVFFGVILVFTIVQLRRVRRYAALST